MNRPKVTLYCLSHNYGRYLSEAVESVLAQTFKNWELILIDDASEDETARIGEQFHQQDPQRIRFFRQANRGGIRPCANLALEESRGEYIMRLDADDFLDESALLVLSTYLDQHPDVALVYPNYFYVDPAGKVVGVENRKRIGREAKLLDLPPHGACTLVRKRILKNVGGYSETATAQDGYELWSKILHRYPVANISTPLFYYRQHPDALSSNESQMLTSRQQIARELVDRTRGKVKPRIVGIIPARNNHKTLPNIVLTPFAGKPLLDYTLEAARESGIMDALLVSTEDVRVAEYCQRLPDLLVRERLPSLSQPTTRVSEVLHDALMHLETECGIFPDVLVMLSVHSPLRRHEFIRQALDTLLLHPVDSILSVYEDYDLHFSHGENGLLPLNPGMHRQLRFEREALYVDNGAILAVWRDVVTSENHLGRKIGHIVMPRDRSFQIKTPFDAWLVERILLEQAREPQSA